MHLRKFVPDEVKDSFMRDLISGICVGLFSGAINPFIFFIARDKLHASDTIIGILTALPFAGMFIAGIYANLTRSSNQVKAVFWPLFFGRTMTVFTLFATSAFTYTLILTPMMLGNSMVAPAYAAVMTQIYPSRIRGTLMALVRVGVALATLITTQIVGYYLKNGIISFKILFAIASILGSISAISFGTIKPKKLTNRLLDVTHKTGIEYARCLRSILKEDREYLCFIIATFIFGFGNIMCATLMPIYQVDKLHITSQQVAILANISTVAWMLSYPYWGKYVDVKSPVKALVITIAMISLIPINYILAPNAWMLVPSSLVNGFVVAGTDLAYFAGVIYFTKPGLNAEYQSIFALAAGIRGLTAPFCVPLLIKFTKNCGLDIRILFGIDAFLILSGSVLLALTLTRHMKHRHDHAYSPKTAGK